MVNVLWFFFVGHAPTEDDTDEHKYMFWDLFECEVSRLNSTHVSPLIIVLFDANAGVGSIVSEAIGGISPEAENGNGATFRGALDLASLCAVNTMSGSGAPTWCGSRGHLSRIDYFCVTIFLRMCV